MNTPEVLATIALVGLAAWTIYRVCEDKYREVMALPDDWPMLDEWEASTEASIVEALALVDADEMPVPLRESTSADRVAAILAANEASRADWDEPSRWQA